MQILDDIVISKYEPANTDVLWLDISSEYTQIKSYINGYWKPIPFMHMNNIYNNSSYSTEVILTIDLQLGNNHVSFYVNIGLNDLKTSIEDLVNNNIDNPQGINILIKANNGKYTLYNGIRWKGLLQALDLSESYLIVINNLIQGLIYLHGNLLNIQQTNVYLNHGANWINNPYDILVNIDDALKYFNPNDNDVIKDATNGHTAIYENNHWAGNLKTLIPGHGLIYTNRGESRTVLFNSFNSAVLNITIDGQNIYIKSIGIDNAPIENSPNLITSGAVYAALHQNDTTEP